MDDKEIFELVRESFAQANQEYLKEQVEIALSVLTAS